MEWQHDLSGVSEMADWMDGEIDIQEQKLSNGQIFALLRMTGVLSNTVVIQSVGLIKEGITDRDFGIAHQIWGELSEEEQTALWVAPKFGGIFTTEERKIIKGGFKND